MIEAQDEKSITLIIDSRLDHLPLLAYAIKGICANMVEDEWLLYQLELCAMEAATNIIVHAYQNQPGHTIEVVVHVSNDCLSFKFLDSGLKNEKLPCKKVCTADFDLADLAESGRGLTWINEFMDDFTFGEEQGKNVTLLTKRFK